MIEERTEELAALYALGVLSIEETGYFEEILRRDPEVAALVHELQESAASFAHLAPVVEPSPQIRAQLLSTIRSEKAGATETAKRAPVANVADTRSEWFPWALAAGLALLATFLAVSRLQTARQLEGMRSDFSNVVQQNERRDAAAAQVQKTLATLTSEHSEALRKIEAQAAAQTKAEGELATLRGEHENALREIAQLKGQDELSKLRIATLSSKMKESPQTLGSVAWDGDKQRGVLTLEKIPPAGAAQDYQLWIIDPHYPQPVSGGVVHIDEHGDARIVFKVEVPIHAADKFAVSRERKGGALSAQGPIVMIGE